MITIFRVVLIWSNQLAIEEKDLSMPAPGDGSKFFPHDNTFTGFVLDETPGIDGNSGSRRRSWPQKGLFLLTVRKPYWGGG